MFRVDCRQYGHFVLEGGSVRIAGDDALQPWYADG